MKQAIAFLMCYAVLHAATLATFTPQGAVVLKNQTGQRIPGTQIVDVIVCSDVPANVGNGYIYQTAVAAGFSPIGASMGTAVVNQRVALDWKHFLVTFVLDGSIDAAVG